MAVLSLLTASASLIRRRDPDDIYASALGEGLFGPCSDGCVAPPEPPSATYHTQNRRRCFGSVLCTLSRRRHIGLSLVGHRGRLEFAFGMLRVGIQCMRKRFCQSDTRSPKRKFEWKQERSRNAPANTIAHGVNRAGNAHVQATWDVQLAGLAEPGHKSALTFSVRPRVRRSSPPE